MKLLGNYDILLQEQYGRCSEALIQFGKKQYRTSPLRYNIILLSAT